jgi:hypothetical protein
MNCESLHHQDCLNASFFFLFHLCFMIANSIFNQSPGFSGASDATRVSILLGVLKVHVDTRV